MAIRTFLALDLDEEIRRRLADLPDGPVFEPVLNPRDIKINWISRANLHVTLKFLGDVPDEKISEVCVIAGRVAAGLSGFEFDVCGVEAIPPDEGQIRMFWAGAADDSGALEQLHAKLDEALSGMGFKEENRRFRPHVTLARIKFARNAPAVRRAVASLAGLRFGLQAADQLTVYGSTLGEAGPVYTPLAQLPFAATT
ncbi:MAG: RNA 2',3'-cyclic phosphodiesterase [Planctomycetes bacterium]|nr:RNA 2',3'-cyclic phosphodiesterase [Planctomycetota bacterium]